MKTKEELALELAASNEPIKDIQCPRNCKNPGLYFGFIKGYEAGYEAAIFEIQIMKAYERSLNMGISEEQPTNIIIGDELMEELLKAPPTHTVVYTTYADYLHTSHRQKVTINSDSDKERIVQDIMDSGGFDIHFFKIEDTNEKVD